MMHGKGFREMLRKCPQHGYELSAEVHIFYNGLNYSIRALIDAACGGLITSKTIRKENQLFEELAKNNYQPPSERNSGKKQGGLIEMDRVSSLEAKFDALMTRLNNKLQGSRLLGKSHTCKHKMLSWQVLRSKLRTQIM